MRTRRRHDPAGMRLDDRRTRGSLLVGIPGAGVEPRPIGQVRGHRAHDLGWLVETAQELIGVDPGARLEGLPPAIDEHEPGAPLTKLDGRGRRHDGPETVPGQHDFGSGRRLRVQQTGALGHRHGVGGEDHEVVGPVVGRRIREAVAAQVHRDDTPCAFRAREAARDGRPDPRRLREPMDRHDPRLTGRDRRPAPVEEVDPIARLGQNDEAIRLEPRVRRRDGSSRWLHRP